MYITFLFPKFASQFDFILLFNHKNLTTMKKRLFFLSFVIALAMNAMAYQSMLVDGRVWTVVHGPGFYAKYDTVMYKIDGDTLIETETYKICLISNEDTWAEMCYLREDAEKQQVWKRETNGFVDNLLFDFTLNVGDTLNYRSRVCEHITTVTDNLGRELKKFILTDQTYIEGYGYESIEPKGYDKGSTIFLCVTEGNDTLIDFRKSKENHTYKSMALEGRHWNVVTRNAMLDANKSVVYSTIVEKIEGDTIINGVKYKKLWHTTDADLTKYELIGIIREDYENQKVYAFIEGSEYLLYDFACSVGDKITTLTSLRSTEQVELTIKTIELFMDLENNIVRKFTAFVENFDKDIIFYERYGSENGWYMRQYSSIVGGGINFMICAFDANDALMFKPNYNNELDEIENCYINETKTNVPSVESQKGDVYYNAENRTLVLDVENPMAITIYDAMGKMVVNRELTTGAKAISLDLNAGIYIVNISTDNQQSIRTKIIVK